MRIIDLTDNFVEYVIRNKVPEEYHATFPDLFAHYYGFWATPKPYGPGLTAQYVTRQAALIRGQLPMIESRFAEFGISLSDLQIVLFVGQSVSNGHAFEHKGKFVVWIPVEAYPSELQVQVFVPHEIVHALHYERVPAFFFQTRRDKNRVSRQVITEGTATYVSLNVMGLSAEMALWADYLPREHVELWYSECCRQTSVLNKHVLDKWDDEDTGLFSLVDPGSVLQFRGGYFVGLRAIEYIARAAKAQACTLMSLGKEELESMVRDVLRND